MRQTIYVVIIGLLCLMLPGKLSAQTFQEKYFRDGIYVFDDLQKIEQSELFTTYKSDFGLGTNDEMVQTNNVVGEDGKFTTKYELYHRGVRVEGALMNVIGDKGIVQYANGFLLTGLNADIDNVITERQAIVAAIQFLDAKLYPWEDSLMEAEIKEDDSNATNYPQSAELIITKKRGEAYRYVDSNYQLCYKVTIPALDPAGITDVYVNANTGDAFTSDDAIAHDYTAVGTVSTWYNGVHSNIKTRSCGTCANYWLHDIDRHIYTTKRLKNWWSKGAYNMDGNNNWVDDDTKTAASAHWCLQRAWDYYTGFHQRWGTDHNGRKVHIQTEATLNHVADAGHRLQGGIDIISITSDGIQPGPSSPGPGYSMAALDYLGHEYTHGMIMASSELKSGGFDARALDEGISDIFGYIIQRYTLGTTDWTWAASIGFPTRYFDNPHNDHQHESPAIYHEPYYWDLNYNAGNYHAAGGVIRKWFHLVTDGGTFNGNVVSPLGITTADHIIYNVFNWWLWSNISYPQAAQRTIDATAHMYGYCSNEYKQVVKAMRAVGFDIPYPWCINITVLGPQVIQGGLRGFIVNPDKPKWIANLNDIGEKMGTYTWHVPSSWHVTTNNGEITLDSVDDYSSQQLSVNYRTDSTEYTDTIVVHFSDVEWQPTNNMPEARMHQPFEEETPMIENAALYPNPANDMVMINVNNFKEKAQVEIYDISGRLIKSQTLTSAYTELDISGLQNGVYVIKTASNGNVSSQKLTVLH